jgi:glycerol-3-phosphate acyltransferase PlsY
MVDILLGILAVIAGYLIGGFPSAYIVTKLATGKDIRTVGTGHTGRGNVGTRNVFVNVGKIPGIVVAILDIVKGTASVALAHWALNAFTVMDPKALFLFILGAGLAAVIGHIWPIYLRFNGGAGLATTIGVLAFLMLRDVAIAFSFAVIFIFMTKNIILSANLSVILIPFLLWWNREPWYVVVYPILLLIIMFIHFLPNIIAEYKKAGSLRNLLAGLLLRNRIKARK